MDIANSHNETHKMPFYTKLYRRARPTAKMGPCNLKNLFENANVSFACGGLFEKSP